MSDAVDRSRVRMLLLAGLAAPTIMAAVGLALAYWRTRRVDLLYVPAPSALLWGALTGGASLCLLNLLYKSHAGFARAIRESGVKIGLEALETAGYPVMFLIVTAAAFGEEVLFRGGLQSIVGLIPAALLFGLSHGGWRREMWAYVVSASLSGALFGVAYRLTGSLWTAITAHAIHNVASTILLGRRIDIVWRGVLPIIRLLPEESLDTKTEVPAISTDQLSDPARPTARQMGLVTGILPTGTQNDICDVPGVRVGHATIVTGSGDLQPGQGPVRTGVTAILPHEGNLFQAKVPAGLFVLNGFGKSTGLAQIEEMGQVETPIVLTNTLSAFRAADALVSYMLEQNPEIGITTGTVNPVVGECNDGYLNDIQGRHVTEGHVREALATASTGPVPQGAVGAGTGTVCFGFKGGIGSASRLVDPYLLGALVQTNFGDRESLMVAGAPVGQHLADYPGEKGLPPDDIPPGSVMVVLATDAPLDARQLTRIARRGALGLARVGASATNGSGDFILAFSTVNRIPHRSEETLQTASLLRDDAPSMDQLFLAAVEAVEEAVLNSLFAANTVEGRDGHVAPALPVQRVLELVGKRVL